MSGRSARQRWWSLGLAALLGASSGCHRAPANPGSSSPNSETILIMLSEARAWQRRADLELSDGNTAGAIAAVREVLAIPFPLEASEAEEVRLDASARLAQLYLGLAGDEGERRAIAQIEEGRRLASHDSFFRAQLESVAAEVYSAQASRLSDGEAKSVAKRQAREALDRAIQIDRRLQRTLLNLPPDSPRGVGQRELP
jgi:hypothetical protein